MAQQFDPYRKWLGIPPEEQPPHHYRLLGIGLYESDPDTIAHAADRQMAHVRSFQRGEYAESSQRLLNELAAARVCLLDAGRKSVYDEWLRSRLKRAATPTGPPPPRAGETTVAAPPPPPTAGRSGEVRSPQAPPPPGRTSSPGQTPSPGRTPSPSQPSRGGSQRPGEMPTPAPPSPAAPRVGPPGAFPAGGSVPGASPGVRPPQGTPTGPARPQAPTMPLPPTVGPPAPSPPTPSPSAPAAPGGAPVDDDPDDPIRVKSGSTTYSFYRRRSSWLGPALLMAAIAAVVLVIIFLLLMSEMGERGRSEVAGDRASPAAGSATGDGRRGLRDEQRDRDGRVNDRGASRRVGDRRSSDSSNADSSALARRMSAARSRTPSVRQTRVVTLSKPAEWSPGGARHRLGEILRLTGHDGPVDSAALLPEADRVVSAAEDGTVRLWDISRGEHLQRLMKFRGPVRRVAADTDAMRVAAFTASGEQGPAIELLSITTETPEKPEPDTPEPGLRVIKPPEDNSAQGRAVTRTVRSTARLPLDELPSVVDVAFAPKLSAAAVLCEDGSVHLYDLPGGKQQRTMRAGSKKPAAVAFSPTGMAIAVAAGDEIVLFSPNTGDELRRLTGHRAAVRSVAFSRDGKQLISGGDDARVRIWDIGSGKATVELQSHTAPVTAVAFGPNGENAVSGDTGSRPDGGGMLRWWRITAGEEGYHYQVPGGVRDAIYMDDDLRVVTAGGDGSLRVWGLPQESGVAAPVNPEDIGLPLTNPTAHDQFQNPNEIEDVPRFGDEVEDDVPRFGDDQFNDTTPEVFGPE